MTEQRYGLVAARELVARLGGHALSRLAIEPAGPGLGRWWILACLLSARGDPARALAAFAALERSGPSGVEALAAAEPARVAAVLEASRLPDAARLAARLVRSAQQLGRDHAGSLERVAAQALDLDELGAALARLAPGIGAATVARFLRPLRERFAAAREVPLAASARAAALHLGWLRGGEDAEGEPSALRRALAAEPGAPPLHDVEAALERLGSASCLRQRPARCPLGADCPVR